MEFLELMRTHVPLLMQDDSIMAVFPWLWVLRDITIVLVPVGGLAYGLTNGAAARVALAGLFAGLACAAAMLTLALLGQLSVNEAWLRKHGDFVVEATERLGIQGMSLETLRRGDAVMLADHLHRALAELEAVQSELEARGAGPVETEISLEERAVSIAERNFFGANIRRWRRPEVL